jgi:hypothetical protein
MQIWRVVAVERRSLDLAPPWEYGSGVTNPGRSRGVVDATTRSGEQDEVVVVVAEALNPYG